MAAEILGFARDLRSNTHVIYAQLTVPEYLSLVGEEFDQFEIQRTQQKHKIYKRMRDDVVEGALLPSITLALKFHLIETVLPLFERGEEGINKKKLLDLVFKPDTVNILDGLQRTHILHEISSSGHQFKEGQKLLIEIWLEPELKNLIYRIIVLNAGQKPMTIRHQIELLFLNVRDKLSAQIPGLELLRERDETRRRGPGKFALDRVAAAYHAFAGKTPEVEKDNLVAQELMSSSISSLTELELQQDFARFVSYLERYVRLDTGVYRIYQNMREQVPDGPNWLALENVMMGFFAAVSDFGRTEDREERVKTALDVLQARLASSSPGTDVLDLEKFRQVVFGYSPRKANVGRATRRLLFTGFKEFFREEGQKSLGDCWLAEAE